MRYWGVGRGRIETLPARSWEMGQLWRLGISHKVGLGGGHGTWGYTGERLYPDQGSQVNSASQVHRGGAEKARRSLRKTPFDSPVPLLPVSSVLRKGERKWARNVLKQNKFVSFYTVGPKSQNIQSPLLWAHVTLDLSPCRVQGFCNLTEDRHQTKLTEPFWPC